MGLHLLAGSSCLDLEGFVWNVSYPHLTGTTFKCGSWPELPVHKSSPGQTDHPARATSTKHPHSASAACSRESPGCRYHMVTVQKLHLPDFCLGRKEEFTWFPNRDTKTLFFSQLRVSVKLDFLYFSEKDSRKTQPWTWESNCLELS